jgi:hypothetical protein
VETIRPRPTEPAESHTDRRLRPLDDREPAACRSRTACGAGRLWEVTQCMPVRTNPDYLLARASASARASNASNEADSASRIAEAA